MSRLQLSFACGLYDRMLALYTGEVKPAGIDLNFIAIDQPRPIFDRMSGGEIELLTPRHPSEDRPRLIDGDEIKIDTRGLHLPGIKREHPVVEPAGKRKLQPGHCWFPNRSVMPSLVPAFHVLPAQGD